MRTRAGTVRVRGEPAGRRPRAQQRVGDCSRSAHELCGVGFTRAERLPGQRSMAVLALVRNLVGANESAPGASVLSRR